MPMDKSKYPVPANDPNTLAAIRARRAAITPPPYYVTTTSSQGVFQAYVWRRNLDDYEVIATAAESDAEFFANAPQDIDTLLTLLTEARADLARVTADRDALANTLRNTREVLVDWCGALAMTEPGQPPHRVDLEDAIDAVDAVLPPEGPAES